MEPVERFYRSGANPSQMARPARRIPRYLSLLCVGGRQAISDLVQPRKRSRTTMASGKSVRRSDAASKRIESR